MMRLDGPLILRWHACLLILLAAGLTITAYLGSFARLGPYTALGLDHPLAVVGLVQAYSLMGLVGVAMLIGSRGGRPSSFSLIAIAAHCVPLAALALFWEPILSSTIGWAVPLSFAIHGGGIAAELLSLSLVYSLQGRTAINMPKGPAKHLPAVGTQVPIQTIETTFAARPLGHYSQAVAYQGMIFVSTQLGLNPSVQSPSPGPIGDQARQALNNVREILAAAGSGLDRVLKVVVYISHIDHWDTVNSAYSQAFGEHRPARGVVACGKLHQGYDVAFEVIAAAR